MYPAYCDVSTFTAGLSTCDNGDGILPERECDGIHDDCIDGSDEGSKCLSDSGLYQLNTVDHFCWELL